MKLERTEKKKRMVYVVAAKQDKLNQRVQGVLLLRSFIDKVTLVTKSGYLNDYQNIVVKPYFNPLDVSFKYTNVAKLNIIKATNIVLEKYKTKEIIRKSKIIFFKNLDLKTLKT